MQILTNTSRKVAVLLETNEQIPAFVSGGFSGLLVRRRMDIVLPLMLRKGCLQTINQFISLRAGTFFRFSHYFSFLSLSVFISQALALHRNFFPLRHSFCHSFLPSLIFSFQSLCSSSVIFNTLLPKHRCMPEAETKRL